MTGSVVHWGQWTGLALLDSGYLRRSQGLNVLQVDRETDEGTYAEPNIWVRHR